MDVEDWLDQQEESERKQRLRGAFHEAKEAGVDIVKVVGDALDGYRTLKRAVKNGDDKKLGFSMNRMLVEKRVDMGSTFQVSKRSRSNFLDLTISSAER